MMTVAALGLIVLWMFVVGYIDFEMKLRKFRRTLAVKMACKWKQGRVWRFGTVKSLHGEMVSIEAQDTQEWVKRADLWPLERWDWKQWEQMKPQ